MSYKFCFDKHEIPNYVYSYPDVHCLACKNCNTVFLQNTYRHGLFSTPYKDVYSCENNYSYRIYYEQYTTNY